ncbi:MAG: rRNA pseudouridine synthase [Clostridiales bacterium]|nr:rRNA pseudouridine synthase [Clostridiales bacterium]
MLRLDKILSDAGCGSRKELRAAIRAGRVTVNGETVRDEARKFDEKTAAIVFDGAPVALLRPVLLMLHKPAGYVTSTDDPVSKTVMELIPAHMRAFGVTPVGRLDKQTEGLLLLTNDGELAHRIISPRHGVWKTYFCEHEGEASQEDAAVFAAGLTLADGTQCLPAKLLPQGAGRSLVFVQEGKYHQVRRMMAARGMPVTYLKRLAEGGLSLNGLEKGGVRELDIAQAEAALDKLPEFF